MTSRIYTVQMCDARDDDTCLPAGRVVLQFGKQYMMPRPSV